MGLSTRAIAESAVRGGRGDHVVTLDYFGDRDQRAMVENFALQRDFDLPFSAEGLLHACQNSILADVEAVVYVSNLENYPDVVEALAQDRVLLGNSPATLRRVRDWRTLRTVCREEGISCPTTLFPGEESR
ncbi:MAG: carboxylate--amine ligase, partial [Chloroflexi bacterium]